MANSPVEMAVYSFRSSVTMFFSRSFQSSGTNVNVFFSGTSLVLSTCSLWKIPVAWKIPGFSFGTFTTHDPASSVAELVSTFPTFAESSGLSPVTRIREVSRPRFSELFFGSSALKGKPGSDNITPDEFAIHFT